MLKVSLNIKWYKFLLSFGFKAPLSFEFIFSIKLPFKVQWSFTNSATIKTFIFRFEISMTLRVLMPLPHFGLHFDLSWLCAVALIWKNLSNCAVIACDRDSSCDVCLTCLGFCHQPVALPTVCNRGVCESQPARGLELVCPRKGWRILDGASVGPCGKSMSKRRPRANWIVLAI